MIEKLFLQFVHSNLQKAFFKRDSQSGFRRFSQGLKEYIFITGIERIECI